MLITGGTGSLGTALTFRLVDDGFRVRTLSRSEDKRAKLKAAAKSEPYSSGITIMAGDVTDPKRLKLAFRGVDTVVHAAALKRIDMCETDPIEAKRVNVDGTENVIEAAIAAGVRKAVLISTDKACAPSTHYGATKLCAERMWIAANNYSAGPAFVALRYGNVFGSAGSVIHAFREQWKTGSLSLTDSEATRFSITLPQAVTLVRAAMDDVRPGDLFIPKLPAYHLIHLAEAYMDEFPPPAAAVNLIGLRPAEKLHESLISLDESESVAMETPGGYILNPNRTFHGVKRFAYTSEKGPFLSNGDLRKLIRESA